MTTFTESEYALDPYFANTTSKFLKDEGKLDVDSVDTRLAFYRMFRNTVKSALREGLLTEAPNKWSFFNENIGAIED